MTRTFTLRLPILAALGGALALAGLVAPAAARPYARVVHVYYPGAYYPDDQWPTRVMSWRLPRECMTDEGNGRYLPCDMGSGN